MIKNVGMTFNPGREDILDKVKIIVGWLEKKKIRTLIPDFLPAKGHLANLHVSLEKINKEAELIISIGGDGTLCRSARVFSPASIPMVGFNMGGLGFLTEAPVDKFEQSFEKILLGEYTIEQRMMLQSQVTKGDLKNKQFIALNDVVVSKSSLPRIISLKTFVSDEFVTTYSSDGLIIATPTGSTAYSLSAGGPIIHPHLQLIILAPICAHTLSVRPLVISKHEVVKITPLEPFEDIFFTIDGQETHPITRGESVEIKKGPHPAKLIRFNEESFFEILQTKLGWSGITYKTHSKQHSKQ